MNQYRWQPVLVAFGSNIDPLHNLQRGLTQLDKEIGIAAISTIYRTSPLGGGSSTQPEYLNGALLLAGAWNPWELKPRLRQIEAACQRVRTGERNAPRTLDLDIAIMGDLMIETAELTIPDPEIALRPFLAIPLAELLPELIEPKSRRSLAELAAAQGMGGMIPLHGVQPLQLIERSGN